jgi:hypothetical protein
MVVHIITVWYTVQENELFKEINMGGSHSTYENDKCVQRFGQKT